MSSLAAAAGALSDGTPCAQGGATSATLGLEIAVFVCLRIFYIQNSGDNIIPTHPMSNIRYNDSKQLFKRGSLQIKPLDTSQPLGPKWLTTPAAAKLHVAWFPSPWSGTPRSAKADLFIYIYIYMDVSENNGTPKPSISIGFSIINHPFWGTPIVGNTHIYIYTYI